MLARLLRQHPVTEPLLYPSPSPTQVLGSSLAQSIQDMLSDVAFFTSTPSQSTKQALSGAANLLLHLKAESDVFVNDCKMGVGTNGHTWEGVAFQVRATWPRKKTSGAVSEQTLFCEDKAQCVVPNKFSYHYLYLCYICIFQDVSVAALRQRLEEILEMLEVHDDLSRLLSPEEAGFLASQQVQRSCIELKV